MQGISTVISSSRENLEDLEDLAPAARQVPGRDAGRGDAEGRGDVWPAAADHLHLPARSRCARARAGPHGAPHAGGRGEPLCAQPPCASPSRGRRRAARACAPASFTRQLGEAREEARAAGERADQLDGQLAEAREEARGAGARSDQLTRSAGG